MKGESRTLLLLGAVQFVNVLDIMMVMPLGPDFAKGLGFSASHLGWVGGAYTASSAMVGLFASAFLDRFDRKKALVVGLAGLALSTVLGGLSSSFATLVLARVVAGAFGGPVTALTFSSAVDSTPPERRGRAMGTVMSAFALAAIFGVPAGLELARHGGWRTPFFAIGSLVFLVLLAVARWVPMMSAHVAEAKKARTWRASADLLRKSEVWFAYLTMAAGMGAGFMLIPNIAAYFEYNLGFPRENLGQLYLVGGLISGVLMVASGKLVDVWSASGVGALATVWWILAIYLGFYLVPPPISILATFVGLMASNSIRSVASAALASKVPAAHERARFTSILSVCQHTSSASGAFFAASLLTEADDKKLVGFSRVSLYAMVVAVFIAIFLFLLEWKVKQMPKADAGVAAEVLGAEVG